jgi:hypothetical protein
MTFSFHFEAYIKQPFLSSEKNSENGELSFRAKSFPIVQSQTY